MNEAATLQFISQNSAIPVPRLLGCFEDSDAVYLIMEYVDGVGMQSLNDDQRAVVTLELQQHLQTLAQLRSSRIGGPSALVVSPHRVINKTYRDDRKFRPGADDEFGFCHNDLSQHNVIVDPETLKIRAIIDWEYAGFYPAYFEAQFNRRIGPSVALANETDDTQQLLDFLQRQESP